MIRFESLLTDFYTQVTVLPLPLSWLTRLAVERYERVVVGRAF